MVNELRPNTHERRHDRRVEALLAAAAAPAEPGPQPGEAEALTAFRAAALTRRSRRRPARGRRVLAVVTVSAGLLLTGGVAASATGALPLPAEGALHDLLARFGVEGPANDQQSGSAEISGSGAGGGGTGSDTDSVHPGTDDDTRAGSSPLDETDTTDAPRRPDALGRGTADSASDNGTEQAAAASSEAAAKRRDGQAGNDRADRRRRHRHQDPREAAGPGTSVSARISCPASSASLDRAADFDRESTAGACAQTPRP
jgi:hypothetical protein